LGLRVDNLEAAAAELKQRGATFIMEPRTIRPGVKIAFVQGPDDVRIELLERS
jgi:lactoylglutathione lyase